MSNCRLALLNIPVRVAFFLGLICLRGFRADAADWPVIGATLDASRNVAYPECPAVVDVTQSPYFAKGDGTTDDTVAIQQALSDVMGQYKLLYFPNGTYLVSKTLNWSKKNSAGKDAWGKNFLQGQNCSKTIIRLKDATFTEIQKPQAIMWCGGFGSADWFHNYVQDMTFDVGNNNPGAIGLQFYSNNTGSVRNCRFIAGEGSGLIGLDLAHRDMNGPLLVRNCEVVGFARGIATALAVNSQTFENITLRGQTGTGFANEGQPISIRGLLSENAVPALSTYGSLLLTDAKLIGRGDAAKHPAIVNFNGGRIFLRDVHTSDYKRALADLQTPDFAAAYRVDGEDKPGSAGPHIPEYCSHEATTAFPSPQASLRLPVKKTPVPPVEESTAWVTINNFPDDPDGQQDYADVIQHAVDSGATTIFLPSVHYQLSRTVILRGKVQRVHGMSGLINYGKHQRPDFRLADGEAPVVFLENISGLSGGLEIDTRRTVVLRSVGTQTIVCTPRSEGGEVFLEDVVGDNFRFRRQRVWARQLNIENEGTHLTNNGGDLWVLGYKTERGGTLVHTLGGGRTEILGGFSYTTTAGKLAPMFVNDDSAVWSFFAEVCFNGDPFAVRVQETRNGTTRTLGKDEAHTVPYSGYPARR